MSTLGSVITFIDVNAMTVQSFEQNAHLAIGTIENHQLNFTDFSSNDINNIIKRYGSQFIELGFSILEIDDGRCPEYIIVERDLTLLLFGAQDR